MKYKKGDRVLYNRQKFGTVYSNQFNPSEVDVVFDREKGKIVLVRIDMLELVSDPQHEATLAAQINSPARLTDGQNHQSGLPSELNQLAAELEAGADKEGNILRLRTTMKEVSAHLRNIARGL